MLHGAVASVVGLLVDFVSDKMEEIYPPETPSSSPVPHWGSSGIVPMPVYNWVEITDEFVEACNELPLGELVKEQNFGLYEAMSAIEMMDPKMDAGMVGRRSSRKILSFKESIEEDILKVDDMKPSELIIIMDHCHTCILSWLNGQSLAQTVFTCLYLHDPTLIQDRCLKAFSFAVLKLCDMIMDKIVKANVYEEEDFQNLRYGFKFAPNLTTLRVIGMLKEVEDEYGRLIRSAKSSPHSTEESDASEADRLDAVLRRVRFIRLFLQVLSPFGKKETEPASVTRKLLHQMQDHLKVIDSTLHLGLQPEVSGEDDQQELVLGFEPLVNQRLLPPTFPRYTKLRPRSELLDGYTDVIQRMLSLTEMTSLSTFQGILEFIVTFGQSNPCVLTRSLAQITFLPENRRVFGSHALVDQVRDSIRVFICPPIIGPAKCVLHNDPRAKDITEALLGRAALTMSKLIQVYGHNYARQREKLAIVLEDLAALQDDADRVDQELHDIMKKLTTKPADRRNHVTCISGWALFHTLKVMTQYLLIGFDLELYSIHEIHYIYWYLSEVILSWMVTTLNRADVQLSHEESIFEKQNSASTSRSHKKTKKNKKVKVFNHKREAKYAQTLQMLCAGMFKAVLGFFIDGKMKAPDCQFDSEAIRFDHRFAPFICVTTPPFSTYKHFQEMTDITQYYPQPTAQDLYLSSSKHFAQAKSYLEELGSSPDAATFYQTEKLVKISKTNMVVTKLLAGGHKKDASDKPLFDFSVVPAFPIIKLP